MKRLFLILLCLFFPALTAKADTMGFNDKTITIAPAINNQQNPSQLETPKVINLRPIVIGKSGHRSWDIDYTELMATGDAVTQALYAPSIYNYSSKPPSADLLSTVSPDYKVNKNFLALKRVSYTKHRETFTFVFFMNTDKIQPKNVSTAVPQRSRMHLLWTGPNKMMPKQKVFDDQYPVDVSIANDDDGYAEGEWNLVLPNKKPHEVIISLLWAF